MGLDLRLLPCEGWREEDDYHLWGYSHTILELGGIGEDAQRAFQKMVDPYLAKLPAGHDITSFVGALVSEGCHKGEYTYGTLRDKDAYGSPYEVVLAKHLLPWIVEHFQYDGRRGGPYQAAIVAYVRALPSDTKIILDWH
jgi:hypothetical protein